MQMMMGCTRKHKGKNDKKLTTGLRILMVHDTCLILARSTIIARRALVLSELVLELQCYKRADLPFGRHPAMSLCSGA
jgi:hypothetical protein